MGINDLKINLSDILNLMDLQGEAERILDTEKSIQESTAKSKQDLEKIVKANNNIHVLVTFIENAVSVNVYETNIEDDMSDYASMVVANCESIISGRLNDMVQDQIDTEKLAELVQPKIIEELQNAFNGGGT